MYGYTFDTYLLLFSKFFFFNNWLSLLNKWIAINLFNTQMFITTLEALDLCGDKFGFNFLGIFLVMEFSPILVFIFLLFLYQMSMFFSYGLDITDITTKKIPSLVGVSWVDETDNLYIKIFLFLQHAF